MSCWIGYLYVPIVGLFFLTHQMMLFKDSELYKEKVLGMQQTFVKRSEVLNLVLGRVYLGLFDLGILVLVILGK